MYVFIPIVDCGKLETDPHYQKSAQQMLPQGQFINMIALSHETMQFQG